MNPTVSVIITSLSRGNRNLRLAVSSGANNLSSGVTLLLVSVAVFVLSSALAFSNKRMVVIGVSSVLGAVLAVSGLTALLMTSPQLYGTFSALARDNVLIVVFILLVPTVISGFYQVSEVRRIGVEL